MRINRRGKLLLMFFFCLPFFLLLTGCLQDIVPQLLNKKDSKVEVEKSAV